MLSQAEQARSHHARQAAIAAAAASAVQGLVRRPLAGWTDILTRLAAYQLAAAQASVQTMAALVDRDPLVNPARFAGVSSAGFPLSEPLVAAIDYVDPAPVEALPDPWWDIATAEILTAVGRVAEGLVRDAGRAAFQAELVATPDHQNYVRMLVPPSCKRCVVLAGRIYRDLDGFQRHDLCDCVHWPVQDWEEAHDEGLVSSPMEAFEKGHIRDLTEGERKAIEDGADIGNVINSSSGIYTADMFGRRVKATRYGTTKRSAWRKQNPSLLVRLHPEAIYRIADGDRDEALRLLRLYGYLV